MYVKLIIYIPFDNITPSHYEIGADGGHSLNRDSDVLSPRLYRGKKWAKIIAPPSCDIVKK